MREISLIRFGDGKASRVETSRGWLDVTFANEAVSPTVLADYRLQKALSFLMAASDLPTTISWRDLRILFKSAGVHLENIEEYHAVERNHPVLRGVK